MKKPVAGLLRPLFQREVFAMLALSTELLEDLANQVLTDYFGTDHFPIHPVEIELFARHYLRLNIQYDKRRFEGSIVYVDMPVSYLAASAGTGAFLDEGNFEMVSVPKNTIPAGAEFGIRVSGDSMMPTYCDGQIVWIQQCQTLNPGEVGIFIYDTCLW